MSEIEPKLKVALLRVLRDDGGAVSSRDIAARIEAYGFDVSPRTIRAHLQRLADAGLVAGATRGRSGGRCITDLGRAEIEDAAILDRVGFTATRVDRLAWQMRFSPEAGAGSVVMNVTLIDAAYLTHAIREMSVVFQAGLGMGNRVAIIPGGEHLGGVVIPPRKIGIGTVCSVTVNGVLLNHRIHAASRFGAVLELRDGKPVRFTDLIAYDGTTLDPLEVFIKAGLTDVHNAAITGNGRIGISFREIPNAAVGEVEQIRQQLRGLGLDGVLLVGRQNQPLLDFPVHEGCTGMIVAGGLNPAAALEEAGIATSNTALSTICDYGQLVHYREMNRVAMELVRRR
jgi:repressor of nif and glnA expression